MSSIAISGDTSGAVSIAAPAIAGTNTMTLVAGTGSLAPKVLGTAVASTSGTSIDFTNIPSWATRITVMFNGVSTSGTSNILVQIGSGSVVTTGYAFTAGGASSSVTSVSSTAGFLIPFDTATQLISGLMTIVTLGNNVYVATWVGKQSVNWAFFGGGDITLAGALDRIRITTASGTPTFDAGTINIMYE